MRYSLVQGSPLGEPITLAEAKLHLRIESNVTTEDDLVDGLISGAREWAENYCRRSFTQRALVLKMDCFPDYFSLPRGPVQSVESVQYVDQDDATAAVASGSYQVDTDSLPGRIVPILGFVWPTPKFGSINGVIVNYTAGYDAGATSPTDYAANVPMAIKAALKIIVAHFYENRELMSAVTMAEMPFAVKALLAPFEIRDFRLE